MPTTTGVAGSIYIDGVRVAYDSTSASLGAIDCTMNAVHIANNSGATDSFSGTIDDVRLSVGAPSRYTGTHFSRPFRPVSYDASTLVLANFDTQSFQNDAIWTAPVGTLLQFFSGQYVTSPF